MTQPIEPELRDAVLSIIAILTGLELGEDAAVTEILEQPLRVDEARAYIGALIVMCQHLVQTCHTHTLSGRLLGLKYSPPAFEIHQPAHSAAGHLDPPRRGSISNRGEGPGTAL